jgi:hypothetical protein
MDDRNRHIATMIMAAARTQGWKPVTMVWDIVPNTVLFSFNPPGQLPFAIAVTLDAAEWERDTSPSARLKVAQDAIQDAQRNAVLNGLDPTGPARAANTEAQDLKTHG